MIRKLDFATFRGRSPPGWGRPSGCRRPADPSSSIQNSSPAEMEGPASSSVMTASPSASACIQQPRKPDHQRTVNVSVPGTGFSRAMGAPVSGSWTVMPNMA
jgi:hypothetical protein